MKMNGTEKMSSAAMRKTQSSIWPIVSDIF